MQFSEIKEGQKASHEYVIDQGVYEGFINTFADTNPLHVDDNYAKEKGFNSKVMHGAVVNGLLSNFIGIVFPSENVMIQSVDIEYKKPNYLGDKILVEAFVEQKSGAVEVLVIKIDINNLTQDYLCAKAIVQVGFLKG